MLRGALERPAMRLSQITQEVVGPRAPEAACSLGLLGCSIGRLPVVRERLNPFYGAYIVHRPARLLGKLPGRCLSRILARVDAATIDPEVPLLVAAAPDLAVLQRIDLGAIPVR